jgi:hypothetical protein
MIYTRLLGRICSGASKIYVCQEDAKYGPDACAIHPRRYFFEIFETLIKSFCFSFDAEFEMPTYPVNDPLPGEQCSNRG